MHDILAAVEPLIPALRRYARALLRDRTAADDLVHDCLERTISRWHQRRPETDARAWVFTILHNLAMNRLRQAARRGPHVELDDAAAAQPPTSVSLFDQGILQVMQAQVTGLTPKQPYVLALSTAPDGSGRLEPLSAFTANPAGAAIVNALGPIRQLVASDDKAQRRYLVIAPGTPAQLGAPVQVQAP